MKDLIIIGARGCGREVADWAKSCIGYGSEFVIKGFLDGKADALDGFGEWPPILGNVEGYKFSNDEVFVVALGDPKWKRHYAEIALSNGGLPYTLIEQSARIGAHSKIGKGCLVLANARISVNCDIGDFVLLSSSCVIGHDVKIGAFSHVGAFGFMGGFSSLGENVTMHPRVSVLPHKKVADNATLGAGSVCIRNVKPGITVFGIPAKEI
ncbi:MAG: acetyltransferase [Kiritimatiellae bacterium]|nr:acetyltransferase [Kiritimatiellia bacterium]